MRRDSLSDCGIDRVFRQVTASSEIVVIAFLLRQAPKLFLHFVGSLPRADDNFANPAHRLTVRGRNRKCPHIMQNIFGGNGFFANPALRECDIFRDSGIEMMGHHHHVESLFKRVHRIGSRWGRGRWNHVWFAADLDYVGGVSTSGSLGVERVNSSTLESSNCIFDEAAFIQRVCVDQNLHVHVVRDRQTAVDGRWCRTPVFMKLEATCSCIDLLDQTGPRTGVAFSEEPEIYGKAVCGLKHFLNMPGTWSTGRCIGSYGWPRPTAHHRGQA